MKRDFLDLDRIAPEELRAILDDAAGVKAARNGWPRMRPDRERALADRVVALIFEKPSTRTRISFDVGIRQMGGETIYLSGTEMQLGHGETVADTGRVLSRFVDAIMIRTFEPETLTELAASASVPVINGLTNETHPCQIMADVLTFEEKKGPIRGRRITWCGDANNVFASWAHAAKAFDFNLVFTGPETLQPSAAALDVANGHVTIERDPALAVKGADAIVTDAWLSMHDGAETRERKHNQLRPYQVNAELMARASPDAIFMHCLPARQGEEVTSEVFESPQSVVFDEAENRLHAQKGILRWCMSA
ncbi:MAG TPA: ornithine carbamoyltransferase [Paracoccaceae bacterium]|nr:ornithine carbamoyltransferase [Paracoccaceae bacterium]